MTHVTPIPAPPQFAPDSEVVDDVEALLLGAYQPLRGFLGAADLAAVEERGELADGTPWPVPIRLVVPAETVAAARTAGALTLVDEEASPVATVEITEAWAIDDSRQGVAGRVAPLAAVERGGYRELRRDALAPAQRPSAEAPVLAVPVDRPLHLPDLAALVAGARSLGAQVLLIPLTGSGHHGDLDGEGLVRCCLAARDFLEELGAGKVEVVPVAVPRHAGVAEDRHRTLLGHVVRAYGATHTPAGYAAAVPGLVVAELPNVVQDLSTGMWGTGDEIPADHRATVDSRSVDTTISRALEHGEALPQGLTLPAVERELRRGHRAGGGRGFMVLLSGFSGSGKSTIAKALHSALLERTDRTVSLLDGDVVRRMLSSELSFSRPHRELNVRRIGYVASEVVRHGGIALCAPIAPYASTRAEVRRMVERHGGFLLVHVATPLAVCEQRDRKGLYAKARAGLIPEFTGISDPYETPTDADLVLDTSETSLEDAVELILAALSERRWLSV